MNKTDILIEKFISLNGNKKNLIKTIINPNIGEIKYWSALERLGNTNSLVNNLIASLNGCIRPINLTLLGPLRIWLYPKIFRSNSVTNATFTKIKIIKIKYLNNLIIYR